MAIASSIASGVPTLPTCSGAGLTWNQVATIVYAHGRVPDDDLWAALEHLPGAIRAGDVLGPRTAEEAVLEGTTAVLAG